MFVNGFILIFYISVMIALTKAEKTTDNEWGLLVFAQTWPPTFCLALLQKGDNRTCTAAIPDSWIVHGIWPSDVTENIQYCNNSWLLDPEEIRPIEPQLETHWSNLVSLPSPYKFWVHEWNKHGTCATYLKALDSQYKYFAQGLKLINEYSIKDPLREAGILPSDHTEYHAESFLKVILLRFKVALRLKCTDLGGKQLVEELHICLNKSLELIDCERRDVTPEYKEYDIGGTSVFTTCDFNRNILYPHIVENFIYLLDS